MGTRSSKHNYGRKPEYKDHGNADVFHEKRYLGESVDPGASVALGEDPDTSSPPDNDLPELEALTFGGIDPDLQSRVALIRDEEICGAPSESLGVNRVKSGVVKMRRARGQLRPMELGKTPQYLRRLASVSKGLSAKKRKALRDILGDFHWDKVGRVHYLMMLLKAATGYSLPSSFHEQDPLEILMMAEEMDLEKATAIRLPKLFAKAIA